MERRRRERVMRNNTNNASRTGQDAKASLGMVYTDIIFLEGFFSVIVVKK